MHRIVESHIINLTMARLRLERLGSIPGLDVSHWVKLERLFERLVDVIGVDDECGIRALIDIGVHLIKHSESGPDAQQTVTKAVSHLYLSLGRVYIQ